MGQSGHARNHAGPGALLTLAVATFSLMPAAAHAQYEDIRPGDRIVYVQPGAQPLQPGDVNVRRLRRVEDDRNLVYEYERPGETRARQRIVIDPGSVVRDIERSKKPRKAKRKETRSVAARPQTKRDDISRSAPAAAVDTSASRATISPEKSSLQTQPVAAIKTPAVVPGETRPRENKNVRVIPLYKPAQSGN